MPRLVNTAAISFRYSAELRMSEIGFVSSEATLAATGFNDRLELKTDALVAVNSFINRAIEDNGLLEKVGSKAGEDMRIIVNPSS